MIYTLQISPKPTPRPRLGRFGTYNVPEYTKYKEDLVWLIKAAKIPVSDYGKISVTFYMPYPKSTAKKALIEGMPHRVKPDADNYFKACADALEQAGIIKNDSQLYSCSITKKYTIEQPKIEIELL